MFRGRREDRRDERQQEHATFGRGGNAIRYQMRQRLVSIGDDYNIDNDRGEHAFKVDGKALRVRNTLLFEDPQGHELCKIQERMLRVKDTMEIEGPNGETLATVKKALITPVRERWTVKVGSGPDLEVQGNIVDHEYRDGGWRPKSRRSLEEVVPGGRHLWRGDRAGPERCGHPGGDSRGGYDGAPRSLTRQAIRCSVTVPSCAARRGHSYGDMVIHQARW